MKLYHLLAATLSLTFAACSQETMKEEEQTRCITFLSDHAANATEITRGTQVSSLASFGVSAAIYDSGSSYASAPCGSFFHCLSATSGVATSYYWPVSGYKMAFYAYYPYNNANLTASSASTVGRPVYTYTVPQAIASQVDVMTAELTDRLTSNTSNVSLSFGHRCSDLRFKVYNQQSATITVKRISVYGVKYSGTYTTGTSWSLTGSANSSSSHPFTLTVNTNVTSGSTVDVTGTSNHFLMLPQNIAADTDFLYIETEETVAGDTYDRNYTYTLPSAFTMAMGESYDFTLTLGNGQLLVSNTSSIMDWQPVINMEPGTISITNWQAQ